MENTINGSYVGKTGGWILKCKVPGKLIALTSGYFLPTNQPFFFSSPSSISLLSFSSIFYFYFILFFPYFILFFQLYTLPGFSVVFLSHAYYTWTTTVIVHHYPLNIHQSFQPSSSINFFFLLPFFWHVSLHESLLFTKRFKISP